MRKYKQKLLPTETSKSTERDQWTDIIELSQTVNQERKKLSISLKNNSQNIYLNTV